ncbi:MAG: hypothetical protein KTV77_03105 [Wolbachia endosymbiont of Fragariocoptes setiger]|nr:hypothetical protein [Wolbachia endosymbiont of Fragariocoptes setiger]
MKDTTNYEVISKNISTNQIVLGFNKIINTIRTRGEPNYITYEQALRNFAQFPEINKNTGYFLNQKDPKTKELINKVQERIEKEIINGVVEHIKLRGRKARSFAALGSY